MVAISLATICDPENASFGSRECCVVRSMFAAEVLSSVNKLT